MNVNTITDRVILTTDAQNGFETIETGVRLAGQQTTTQGAGFVNARRYVSGDETTVVDTGDVVTSSFGASGLIASTSFLGE
jgi:hypothetical protein